MRQIVFAAMATLAISATASSQVILGNLPPANDNTQSAVLNDLRLKAFRFTMGSDSIIAGELEMRLRNYDAAGEVNVYLRDYTGDDINPGTTTLMTFSAPSPGGPDIMNYIFSPTSSFTLQANTTYWLVIEGVAGQSFDWMASSPGITPTGLATHGSTSFTTNGGTSWTNSGILNSFEFRAIPAPGALALLGLAGLTARRRRRS